MPIITRIAEVQPLEPGMKVFYDSETGLEIILEQTALGDYIRIRIGNDSLALSPKEWRGLYSAILNVGPGHHDE
jgi:hypothetical protein